MATINVSTPAQARAAIISAASGDTIAFAPGTYDRFHWPQNTTKVLSLVPQDRANPPVLRGLAFDNKPEFYWPSESVGYAKNVTIDGLRFKPELIAKAKLSKTSATLTDITGPDGNGWGWAPDWSYPGVTGLGAGSSMGFTGIHINSSNTTDITIKNCLFEQYTRCIRIGGRPSRINIVWNEFSEMCEDAMYILGANDLNISFNICDNARPLPKSISDLWGYSQSPVHNDFIQCNGGSGNNYCSGLTISHNYVNDDSGRIHGILCTTSAFDGTSSTTGSFHRNVLVEHNYMSLSQGTGFLFGDGNRDLTIRHNKLYKNSGSTPKIAVGGATANASTQHVQFMTNIEVSDNVAPAYVLYNNDPAAVKSEWTVSGNVTINDQTTMPSTFLDPRPSKQTTPPHDIAGRYGSVGSTPVVTKPDPLTDAEWDFDDPIDDPNEGTNKQVGVILFPAGSRGLNATAVKWLGAGTAPQDCVFINTRSDGSKRWRMAGTLGSNSVGPGQTSENIGVYFTTSARPDLSDRSLTDSSYAYKPTTNVKTPITWQWDFSQVGAARWKLSPNSPWEDVVAIRFKKDNASPWETVWMADDYVGYTSVTFRGWGFVVNTAPFQQPNTPAAYAVGDTILGFIASSTVATVTVDPGWNQEALNNTGMLAWVGSHPVSSVPEALGDGVASTGVRNRMTVSIRGLDSSDPLSNPAITATSTTTATSCPVPPVALTPGLPAMKLLLVMFASGSTTFADTLTIDGVSFSVLKDNGSNPRIKAYMSTTAINRNFAGGNVTAGTASRLASMAAFLRPAVLESGAP